mmetsp:Transcript_848/g.725  ORF Transcript_848/g.725 Transcript_848/m.725 type:complete len:125 (+) Transcript_848:704-1078(+)
MKVRKVLKPLYNLNEVSNQSTCSNKSKFENSQMSFINNTSDNIFEVRLDRSTIFSADKKNELKMHDPDNNFFQYSNSNEIPPMPYSNEIELNHNLPLSKWIPDEYSKRCMRCKREFDFFTRKHH